MKVPEYEAYFIVGNKKIYQFIEGTLAWIIRF